MKKNLKNIVFLFLLIGLLIIFIVNGAGEEKYGSWLASGWECTPAGCECKYEGGCYTTEGRMISSLSDPSLADVVRENPNKNLLSQRGTASGTTSPAIISPTPLSTPTSTASLTNIDEVWLIIGKALGNTRAFSEEIWEVGINTAGWVKKLSNIQNMASSSSVVSPSSPDICSRSSSSDFSTIKGTPSISAETINKILSEGNSPAAGTGNYFVGYGIQYGVDPAFALAFFWRESNYGTKGVARYTKGVGNIIYTGLALPDYRASYDTQDEYGNKINQREWSAYNSWENSIKGWYNYIVKSPRYFPKGKYTIEEIIPEYCPAQECNIPKYLQILKDKVREYRELEKRKCSLV